MTQEATQEVSAANTETETTTTQLTLEDAILKLTKLEESVKAAENAKAALTRKLTKFEKEAEEKEAKQLQEAGQYKELYEKAQAEIAAKEQKLRDTVVNSAVKSALTEAGALNTTLVLKLVDLSSVSLNEDGEADLTEFNTQIEELKKSASMLFKSGTTVTPSVQRAANGDINKTAYETELKACKTQKEVDAVKSKYGK